MMRSARLLCLTLGLFVLAACGPDQETPQVSALPQAGEPVLDSQGRVVRSRGERNRDDTIGRVALSALAQADKTAFKGVSVRAWDGAVLLTGAVAKPEQRRRAEQAVRAVAGVAEVHDELVLAENPSHPMYVPNTGLEQQIYAGLLGNDAVSGAYSVRVVNGVAYLQGSARSKADVDKAADFARGFEGIKWVVTKVSVR
jgi:hyperosmotically inducible protein